MPTYDDASLTYDDIEYAYDGLYIDPVLSLLIGSADVADDIKRGSLTVSAATHGNARPTLSAVLENPSSLPDVDDVVTIHVNRMNMFGGLLKVVDVDEVFGSHIVVALQAQGESDETLPTSAPFGLSDNPDGTTTKGYVRLSRQTRTTEGGAPKTTYRAEVTEPGLWANQNIEVTADNYGLSADEFSVNESSMKWGNVKEPPTYTLVLGDPLVKLAQLVGHSGDDDADQITTTQIAEGSITTPLLQAGAITTDKFSADAVIARVANIGSTVVINEGGIAVTGGRITVTNGDGTVVIDGTSNMFKISASGTISRSSNSGDDVVTTTVTLTALGTFSATPMHMSSIGSSSAYNSGRSGPYAQADASDFVAATSGGAVNQNRVMSTIAARIATYLDGSDQCEVELRVTNSAAGSQTWHGRYYVLVESAI